ncbi:MAG: transferase [Brasilonema octagenarum HA4186-MV1]|jgi:carbon dioxide concentrating mechanism protein CcmN|uniref:Transferase n=1 Tax=Brasilonema octagenarum UFV-OR1 TaxID=417115 RepID=A0ABX1MDI0_9CYAN|nr:transferase [Brasilonema octagenarum]MBW4625369.1 transferase [Brasilonema octagenarum HA4186-MV1]NMF66697.1 transferase [Brasilonema octagenarum UFV-OR1]
MSVPPLRPSYDFDSYISGEVIIHPSAVLAPGVILQAAPNSKIIIGSGVCVGMGSILQVHEGTLEVEAGANLGAGLLMVGKGRIGANACIGAATTIFNCSVDPGQVLPAGSVLGDTSRRISESPTQTEQTTQESSITNPTFSTTESENGTGRQKGQAGKEESSAISPSSSSLSPPVSTQDSQISSYIYGQQSIQKLLVTLFPHKQSLNKPISDGEPE